MTLIDKPGIYADMTAAEYHADPAIVPSLSASVAIPLLYATPFHAWLKHPRLNEDWRDMLGLEDDTNGASRFGTVAHELLLGRGGGIHVMQALNKEGEPVRDYRTKAAQEERDEILAQGHTPCLRHELDQAEEVVEIIQSQIAHIPGCEGVFQPSQGRGEVAVFWNDVYDTMGRCLIDWWHENGDVYDLKTSTTDLSDEAIARKIDQERLDVRAAFYLRGIGQVRPDLRGKIRYRFVFAQQKPPYELRVVELDQATLHEGHRKVAYALHRWAAHLESGKWPGYPRRIEIMGMPKWSVGKWAEREADPAVAGPINRDPVVRVLDPEESRDQSFTEIVS